MNSVRFGCDAEGLLSWHFECMESLSFTKLHIFPIRSIFCAVLSAAIRLGRLLFCEENVWVSVVSKKMLVANKT